MFWLWSYRHGATATFYIVAGTISPAPAVWTVRLMQLFAGRLAVGLHRITELLVVVMLLTDMEKAFGSQRAAGMIGGQLDEGRHGFVFLVELHTDLGQAGLAIVALRETNEKIRDEIRNLIERINEYRKTLEEKFIADRLDAATDIPLADALILQQPLDKKSKVQIELRKKYAKFFKVAMPEGTVMQLQDRAYTSPIWYTP